METNLSIAHFQTECWISPLFKENGHPFRWHHSCHFLTPVLSFRPHKLMSPYMSFLTLPCQSILTQSHHPSRSFYLCDLSYPLGLTRQWHHPLFLTPLPIALLHFRNHIHIYKMSLKRQKCWAHSAMVSCMSLSLVSFMWWIIGNRAIHAHY